MSVAAETLAQKPAPLAVARAKTQETLSDSRDMARTLILKPQIAILTKALAEKSPTSAIETEAGKLQRLRTAGRACVNLAYDGVPWWVHPSLKQTRSAVAWGTVNLGVAKGVIAPEIAGIMLNKPQTEK